MLHIAAGAEANLDVRVLGSLPANARPGGLQSAYGEIIRELADVLSTLPPDRRPPNYDRIQENASAASTRPASDEAPG